MGGHSVDVKGNKKEQPNFESTLQNSCVPTSQYGLTNIALSCNSRQVNIPFGIVNDIKSHPYAVVGRVKPAP